MQYREFTGGLPPWTSWISKPLVASTGPLAVDNWTYNMLQLEPGTILQYRAYMVVGGTTYYGTILEATTPAEPNVTAQMITGDAEDVTSTSFCVCDNSITTLTTPSPALDEYGVIYTQDGGLSLAYGVPGVQCCVAGTNPYPLPEAYDTELTGLAAGTTTRFRAYSCAASSSFVGVGTTCSQTTNSVITVSMGDTALISGLDSDIVERCCGKIVLSHAMPSGDGFKLNFTNCAYIRIYNPVPWSLEACAKACITPSDCCMALMGPVDSAGLYNTECSGYICVTPSTTISNIPFVVTAQSHAGNDLTDFVNEACSKFTSITPDGGNSASYVLTPTYSDRCICARNQPPGS